MADWQLDFRAIYLQIFYVNNAYSLKQSYALIVAL
jgi:hypothetical protein